MTRDLDDLIRALRDAPPDRDLSAIEPLTWRRLGEEAAWAFFGPALSPAGSLAAARMSLAALALLGGIWAGAAVAGRVGPEADELAVFSTSAPFALSSLLPRS